MATTVVNRHKGPFDVYIGRGTPWGNPFKVGSRETVIEKYRQWLWIQMKSRKFREAMLDKLDGKVLGCSCKPLPCHGDVLVRLLEEAKNKVDIGKMTL